MSSTTATPSTAGPFAARAAAPAGTGSRPLLSPRAPERRAGWELPALVLVLAAALALRLVHLGDGLWFDEIQTLVEYVRLPFGKLLTTYDSQNQHMLFSLLARTSFAIFGESAWALRLPAALLGVASLGALYAFGRMVTSGREALLAAAVLATTYQHVWFSQNARGYTGLMLGTIAASGLFLALLRSHGSRWKPAVLYAIAMALTMWVHVTAAFVALAQGLVWLGLVLGQRRRPTDRAAWMPLAGLVLAGLFTLVLYAPVLTQMHGTLGGETMAGVATAWKDPRWLALEMVRGLARGVPGGLVTVALGIIVVLAGLWSFTRRSPGATALMLLPGIVTAGIIVAMHHNLWPRFFFAYAGFGVLIAVRGVFLLATSASARRGPPLATAALVLASLASAWTVRNAWHPKQDYEGALAYVRKAAAPGDAVAATDMSDYVLREYLRAGSIPVADDADLASVEKAHPRTWFVYTFPDRIAAVEPALWAKVSAEYRPVAEFRGTLGGGSVFVAVSR